MMTWQTADGQTITWDDGLIEGDSYLVELILSLVECDALLTQPGGFDVVIASLDSEEQAFNTITSVLLTEVGLDGLVEVPQFGDPNATDGFTFVKTEVRPPLEKWLKIMLKGRQRRFASRSEAGRYAAYVRWATNAGVAEIASPEQWKQMNDTSAPSGQGESDDPPHIRDAKQAVADLQKDLAEFAEKVDATWGNKTSPNSMDSKLQDPFQFMQMMAQIGVIKIPKDMPVHKQDKYLSERADNIRNFEDDQGNQPKDIFLRADEFKRFGKWCEAQGVAGVIMAGKGRDGVLFIPSPKTIDLLKKIEATGQKIKTAVDIETGQNTPEMKAFFDKFNAHANSPLVSAGSPTKDDLKRLSLLGDARLEVIRKIIPMGIDASGLVDRSQKMTDFQLTTLAKGSSEAQRFVPSAWQKYLRDTKTEGAPVNAFSTTRDEIYFHADFYYGKGAPDDTLYARQIGSVLRHEMTHAAENNSKTIGLLSSAYLSYQTMGRTATEPIPSGTTGYTLYAQRHYDNGIGLQSGLPVKYSAMSYGALASETLTVGLDSYLMFQPQYGRVMNTESLGYEAWSLGMLAVQ